MRAPEAPGSELYEIERTFVVPAENLTEYNARIVYIGVVHAGTCTKS